MWVKLYLKVKEKNYKKYVFVQLKHILQVYWFVYVIQRIWKRELTTVLTLWAGSHFDGFVWTEFIVSLDLAQSAQIM